MKFHFLCKSRALNIWLGNHLSLFEGGIVKDLYMLFAGREIRIGKICARGLEYVLKTFVSSFCVEFSLQSFSNLVYARV